MYERNGKQTGCFGAGFAGGATAVALLGLGAGPSWLKRQRGPNRQLPLAYWKHGRMRSSLAVGPCLRASAGAGTAAGAGARAGAGAGSSSSLSSSWKASSSSLLPSALSPSLSSVLSSTSSLSFPLSTASASACEPSYESQ